MQLPPFVLIEHPTELKDKTLIMQTSPPYIIGQVWRFREGQECDAWIDRNPGARICLISGYNMLISFYGTIDGSNAEKLHIIDVLHDMRNFYQSVRIVPNAPRYNRYKIDRSQ